MKPSRATTLENSDFRLRFFQSSATEKLPSAAVLICKSAQPALKLAATKTRSPSSTTGCAHLGHLAVAQGYSQRVRPSFGSCPVTLAPLMERICRRPARVTSVGELKLAWSLPTRQAGAPSSRRNASKLDEFVMPPVTTTRSSTKSGDEHLPK